MPAISVVICCANVADTLPAACRSVSWADELVIVDSGSTDATAAVAKSLAHRYVLEPWRGYSGQKQFGATLARNPWVLILDGDEEVTPELAREITALTDCQLEALDVVWMRRLTYAFGRPVRAWWPDWQSRLIHRSRAVWTDHLLHEDRRPSAPSRQKRLRGRLLHRRVSPPHFRDYFHGAQLDARLVLEATELFRKGKRCRLWSLWTHPVAAFWRCYITKMGFLDGTFGLLIAQRQAVQSQLKYSALWAMQNGYLQPCEPNLPDRPASAAPTDPGPKPPA